MPLLSRLLISLIVVASLSSCSAKTIYDWGSYEPSIERLQTAQGDFVASDEIETLSEELQDIQPNRIPPGKAAYIGFLHSLQGQTGAAREYFQLEKKLFPESAVFMDRLIAKGAR